MNRIRLPYVIALVPFVLVVAAYTAGATPLPSRKVSQSANATAPQQQTSVQGTVTYHDQLALAADARVTVQLLDASRADGTEVVLGEQAIAQAGRPLPFAFEIGYDAAAIRPEGDYVVGASIAADGGLVYRTTTRPAVITRGHPTTVQLVLTKVDPWSSYELAIASGRLSPHSP